ncbi:MULTISPECIES: hypothetical protein [unclassified Nocardioides]|uniref:hypothetical protein n=1 Tax=unclassified Nocardioides TaxID=2615069 RepID=UPI0009EFA6B7|nr:MULTISPECIES: hypothetical protein [unclassified Nocardioides]GAW49716.1 uncharacterized protein PD653B2_2043 [Nocardioides sp. PD653-B2]GAW56544.1 uncharacterized protein PD653_3981 [Nocardioides sp. PD653]
MATHRHKQEIARRKSPAVLIAAPLALLATGTAVAIGVAEYEPSADVLTVNESAAGDIADRRPAVSRSGSRRTAIDTPAGVLEAAEPQLSRVDKALLPRTVAAAIRNTDTQLWTTTELNLWTRPDKRTRQIRVFGSGKKVPVTGRELLGRQEIVLDGQARWVTSGYLSDEKPDPGPRLGGQCTNGTSVPSSVSPNIQAIHQAVCANFPEITTYGTLRGDESTPEASPWTSWWPATAPGRSRSSSVSTLPNSTSTTSSTPGGSGPCSGASEGWRAMEDRGSVTANHYDHIHVTTS